LLLKISELIHTVGDPDGWREFKISDNRVPLRWHTGQYTNPETICYINSRVQKLFHDRRIIMLETSRYSPSQPHGDI